MLLVSTLYSLPFSLLCLIPHPPLMIKKATVCLQKHTNQPLKRSTLPRRGIKDFEPHHTTTQSSTLLASQNAMHTALSFPRAHAPSSSHIYGILDPAKRMVFVPKAASVHFKSMGDGKGRRDGGVWLLPEEALGLLEGGRMDLRFGREGEVGLEGRTEEGTTNGGENEDVSDGQAEEQDSEEGPEDEREERGMVGLPVSLQAGYAFLIGAHGLTLEKYTVYNTLKRAGYIVKRAPTWDHDYNLSAPQSSILVEENQEDESKAGINLKEDGGKDRENEVLNRDGENVWQRMWNSVFAHRRRREREEALKHGPLVGKGLYRSYGMLSFYLSSKCSILPAHQPCRIHLMVPTFIAHYIFYATWRKNANLPRPISTAEIYALLQIIPHHDPSLPSPSSPFGSAAINNTTPPNTNPLTPDFHIYKPSTPFRKSCPPPPDYHCCVFSTAAAFPSPSPSPYPPSSPISNLSPTASIFPPLPSLSTLFSHLPPQPPDPSKQRSVNERLKHGYKNVLLAVVDNGVVSFMRLAEGNFEGEDLVGGKDGRGARGGDKGRRGAGGGRGGRGRGRGRGGG